MSTNDECTLSLSDVHVIVDQFGICQDYILQIKSFPSWQDKIYEITIKDKYKNDVVNDCFLKCSQLISYEFFSHHIALMKHFYKYNIPTALPISLVNTKPDTNKYILKYKPNHTQTAWNCILMTKIENAVPLYDVSNFQSNATLLTNIGKMIGKMDRCLFQFDCSKFVNRFPYDLPSVGEWSHHKDYIQLFEIDNDTKIKYKHHKKLLDQCVLIYYKYIQPVLKQNDSNSNSTSNSNSNSSLLRKSMIHNDLNAFNILISCDNSTQSTMRDVAGIIDFGDIAVTWTVFDLVIACAHLMMDNDTNVSWKDIFFAVVVGFDSELKLTQCEIDILFPCIFARLFITTWASIYESETLIDAEKDPMRYQYVQKFVQSGVKLLQQLVKVSNDVDNVTSQLKRELSRARRMVSKL